MRVAIDFSGAVKPAPTGIAVYLRSLVEGLAEVRGEEDRFDLCVRFSRLKRWRPGLLARPPGFRIKILQEGFHPFYPRRIHVFHGPDARLPRFRDCALVATIHDVFSLLEEEFADPAFRALKRRRYEDLCRRAHRLITVSESARQDLVRLLGVEEERLRVVPQAAAADFRSRSLDEITPVLRRRNIRGEYVLSVGLISRRKNTAAVVRAFDRVIHRIDRSLQLVLVGTPTYGGQEALRLLQTPGIRERVIRFDSLPRTDLAALYAGARVFLFPSLYEGFGMPVLEAMASGTPVITSNVSSLPEVAGDAAFLVDPRDEEVLAERTLALLEDEALREEYRRRGFARAKRFSWRHTARATLEVYREAEGAFA